MKTAEVQRTKLSTPQVAKRYGINVQKVLDWIRSGELRAINVASKPGGRPRFRVDVADLAAFENARAVVPPAPPAKGQRKGADDTIRYF